MAGVVGWFRMRLNLELRSFAVWEEALDGFGNRNSAGAREPCGCCCWWLFKLYVVKLNKGVDVYSFSDERLYVVNDFCNNSIVCMTSCERPVVTGETGMCRAEGRHFVLLCWRGGRWLRARWLVAGLATRMAGLACARAHRVTEGALRVRVMYYRL